MNEKLHKVNIKHNLYLIKTPNENGVVMLKLGYSKNIRNRLNDYNLDSPFTELLLTCYNEKGVKYEKAIHSKILSDYKDEWYNENKLNTLLNYLYLNKDNYSIYNNFSLENRIDLSKEIFQEINNSENLEFAIECDKAIKLIKKIVEIIHRWTIQIEKCNLDSDDYKNTNIYANDISKFFTFQTFQIYNFENAEFYRNLNIDYFNFYKKLIDDILICYTFTTKSINDLILTYSSQIKEIENNIFKNLSMPMIKIKSEGFYMTFIDYISPLYNLKTDTAKSILSWMCVHAEFNTGIVKLTTSDRKEICTLLSISSNTLTNNITLLKKHKLITGEKGTFHINSEIFWKGDMQTRDKVINSEEFKITFAIN